MKLEKNIKQDKGVAGLTILLSLVTMLFVIGLLVMIFSLMGGELKDTSYDEGSLSVVNESGAYINSTGYDLAELDNYKGTRNVKIDEAYNVSNSSNPSLIPESDYELTDGTLFNATSTTYDDVNVSYSFNYDEDTTSTDVMNDTSTSISSVTDWFSIFIVIGAMVVLVLLTVIIISAIRGSGLISGGQGTA